MKTNEIIVILGFMFLVGIVVGMELHKFLKNKNEGNLAKLKEFIESDEITDSVKEILCNIIQRTDFSKYESFLDAQADMFDIAYDEIWSYAQSKLRENFGDDKLYNEILKLLTRNFVEEYTGAVFLTPVVQSEISEKIQKQIDDNTESILYEENRLEQEAEEYEDENYTSGLEVNDLDPSKVDGSDDNDYNPQSEDEEEYSEDDDSVEVIEERGDGFDTLLHKFDNVSEQ